jgi:hypothetical protein
MKTLNKFKLFVIIVSLALIISLASYATYVLINKAPVDSSIEFSNSPESLINITNVSDNLSEAACRNPHFLFLEI